MYKYSTGIVLEHYVQNFAQLQVLLSFFFFSYYDYFYVTQTLKCSAH